MPRPLFSSLFLLLLWAALYLPGLGNQELKGEEGRRILPAREMLRRGDYVLPYSEGLPYHRKPPGINWAIAASFCVFGEQTEFSARFPSALAALALALVGLWAGTRLLSAGFGLALGTMLLISAGMIEKGRLAEIESLYVATCGIGMLVWCVGWAKEHSPWRYWLVAAIPFAMANLIKGPVWMVFFYGFVVLLLAREKRLRGLWHPAHWLGMALSLAPMLLWGYLVNQRMADAGPITAYDDEGNLNTIQNPTEVWWNQIAGRLQFSNIDWASWLALPFRSLVLFAPWPILALVALRCGKSLEQPRLEMLRRGLGWAILLTGGIFCLLPATRARYLFPLLVMVMLWSGLTLVATLRDESCGALAWKLWRGFLVVVSGVLGVIGLVAPFYFLPDQPWAALAINAVLGIAVLLAWRRIEAWPERFFTAIVPPAVLAVGIAASTLQPWGKTKENVRPVALQISQFSTQPGSLVAVRPGPQPFLFYLGPRCVEVSKVSEFPADTAYVLLSPQRLKEGNMQNLLTERGFTRELLMFTEKRSATPRDYVLLGRE